VLDKNPDLDYSENVSDFIKILESNTLNLIMYSDPFLKTIFLNANEETLVKRFQETRRLHPLCKTSAITSSIQKEKELLEPLKEVSDIIIDTDNLTIHDLRNRLVHAVSDGSIKRIQVNITSFGFKYGVPIDSNVVFDVRFLPNPYFIPALKMHDGREDVIQDYLFEQKEVLDYWSRLRDFVGYSIQKYYQEGRSFVNVAIGCTGGKHRSVTLVEKLKLENVDNAIISVSHRDVSK